MVVDDSVVFRSQIKVVLSEIPGLEVTAVAPNGKLALQKLEKSPVDLMTLDLEMPEMNGLETLKAIREKKINVKVIVFAAQSARGASTTLEALSLGAHDVVCKPSGNVGSIEGAQEEIRRDLVPKILQFIPGKTGKEIREAVREEKTTELADKKDWTKKDLAFFRPEILCVGSSTGGPVALENMLRELRGPLPMPMLIVQHMPPTFTRMLANRLEKLTGIPTMEASDGEPLTRDKIYVAPGDYHMVLKREGDAIVVRLHQGDKRNSVRPAVDELFETAAEVFGDRTMGFILTGMGEDGLEGCTSIKNAGGGVMIQDEATSVVWGMPGAVYHAGAYDQMGGIGEVAGRLQDICTRMG